MENKINDDRLDDFVQKSFEDYEEDPSPGMWGRIEHDLPPAAPAIPSVSLLKRLRWQIAAATAILLLLSGLVYEHFYYEMKINALAARDVEKQEFANEAQEGGYVFSEKSGAKEAGTANVDRPDIDPANSTPGEIEVLSKANPDLIKENKDERLIDFDNPVNPARSQVQPEPDRSIHSPVDIGQKPVNDPKQNEAIKFDETATKRAQLTDFESFVLLIAPLKTDHATDLAFVNAPVRPVREPSGWYVGLQATPHFTIDHSQTPVRRPGGRPVFISRQEGPTFSTDWWLKFGKRINTHFAFESGVGVLEIARTTTHMPRFRFADGIGNNGYRRNFSYDLNTYGGSASVSLRMEQVDTSPVQDDEAISLVIKTSENVQLLRVPVLAVYRLGTGRWQGCLKAGLTGNFFLKNQLDISARLSQNSRFQPVQGNGSYSVQLENQGKFFLGYWFAAGAEFRLSRHFGLIAEPSFSGDFARKDALGRQLPGQYSAGLNMGLNYHF